MARKKIKKTVRVRAKDTTKHYAGFYLNVRRRPGAVFDLLPISVDKYVDGEHPAFSENWMEKVDEGTSKTPAPGEPTREDLIADGIILDEDAEPAPDTDEDDK